MLEVLQNGGFARLFRFILRGYILKLKIVFLIFIYLLKNIVNMIYLKINFRLILKYFWAFYILFNTSTNSFSQFHNQIDDVKTAADIDTILKAIPFGYNYGGIAVANPFEGKECRMLYDSLQIKNWVKRDFDNNGYSDLLVLSTLKSFYCILDSRGNRFYIKELSPYSFPTSCELFYVSTKSNLINYFQNDYNQCNKQSFRKELLVYKFDGFVEYNESQVFNKIEKIEFKYNGELSPSINVDIKTNRRMLFQSKLFGKKTGSFYGKINKIEYQKLIDCLNYIDFSKLKYEYCVNWLHYDISHLKITYNNGQVKTINDKGSIGTFGLIRLYHLITEITQKYSKNKIKRRTPIEARR